MIKYPLFDHAAEELLKLKTPVNKQNLIYSYTEGHRYYHNLDHIEYMLGVLSNLSNLSNDDRMVLQYAILYHDKVYIPGDKYNEKKSAEQLPPSPLNERAKELILSTDLSESVPKESLEYVMRLCDIWDIFQGYTQKLFFDSLKVEKEFQVYDYKKYLDGRIKFLDNLRFLDGGRYQSVCSTLQCFARARQPNIAVYAGTFNGFHVGHLSILQKAEEIFDKVIIAVGTDPNKDSEPAYKRCEKLREIFKHHQVEFFNNYLTDYLASKEYPVTLIRGLRTDVDFKQEEQKLRMMQDFSPDVKVIFIPCDKKYEHVSSTMVRSMQHIGMSSTCNSANDYLVDYYKVYPHQQVDLN